MNMPHCLDNDSAVARVLRAALAIVLVVALCLPAIPASAPAAQYDDPVISAAAVPDADLNAAWTAQEDGVKSAFTITSGGTYSLSADLTTDNYLVVDAKGQDVTIRFAGHRLVVNGSGSSARKAMVEIKEARSVTFDGTSTDGSSALESAGQMDVNAITSSAADCSVSVVGLTVKLASSSNAQRNLSTHCIRMESGSLSIEDSSILMQMENQSLRSANLLNDAEPEVPSAVYAASGVSSVKIVDSKVEGSGSSGFALEDLSDTTTIGNAYALYSLAGNTRVQGGSFKAASARGNATCLYASSLEITGASGGPLALEANAGQIATGILSGATGSVKLDAPFSFKVGESFAGSAEAEAALRSSVQSGFVFGSCLPATAQQKYPVLVMQGSSLSSANADGMYLGTFAGTLSAADRSALLGVLEDSRGNAGSCTVTSDLVGVKFSLVAANAVARITDSAGATTSWSTIDSALGKLNASNGATLTLLKDAGALVIDGTGDATVDLGGRKIASLAFSSQASGAGLVVKNGAIESTDVAINHSSPSPLTLQDVAVKVSSVDVNAYGIDAASEAGKLTLTGSTTVTVSASQVTTTGKSAYGIYMATNGPELVLDGVRVSALTPSAGAAVYGLYSSKSAMIENSTVVASGTTDTTCAAYVGGSLTAKSSTFEASATGAPATIAGVWGRTSAPRAADISIDSSTVRISSESNVNTANHYCLLGATTENGSSPTKWVLSGQNTFKSTSGKHAGMNIGAMTLSEGFSLSSDSDKPLRIAQAKCADDIGFNLGDGVSAGVSSLFTAAEGSYYEGCHLAADSSGSALAWLSEQDSGSGVVELVHNDATTRYGSFAAALASARSGDTLRLLANLSESGAHTISQNNLVIDLNGKTLTVRAGNAATTGSNNDAGAVKYTGYGTLAIQNGTLDIELGARSELSAGATYQGVAIGGGGTLSIASNATVAVNYAGSTFPTAAQSNVVMRGIGVASGKLVLDGNLAVKGAASDGSIGAMKTYGVFAQPKGGEESLVQVSKGAAVRVDNGTASIVTKNTYYPEMSATQSGPAGLREITIDAQVDPAFYQDVVEQFRLSASYDDPEDSTTRNTFGTSIYYAQALVLEREGAWYDGLRIWAFSDVVPRSEVGKSSSIVPAHVFVSSQYETLPVAIGIATGEGGSGSSGVDVAGSVEVACAHGNAAALDARRGDAASADWACVGAELSAQADSGAHLASQGDMDLRDFIAFSTSQEEKVAYTGFAVAKTVRYEPAVARCISVGDGVTPVLSETTSFTVGGCDVAAIEASVFKVGAGFSLAQGSARCSVANPNGANAAGQVFARSAGSAVVDASLFEDAGCALATSRDADGNAIWTAKTGYTVTFKVGDAAIARYADAREIDTAEFAAAAMLPDDQRWHYQLVGWSSVPDENATEGYIAAGSTITPTGDATYYAVYSTALTTVPVSFSNVRTGSGSLRSTSSFEAVYGQTLGNALQEAGVSVPAPSDYTKGGVTYRFVGWYPYSSTLPAAPLLYSTAQLSDLEITLAANGVSAGDELVLRATYLAVEPSQHIVTFVVDGRISSCVVSDGGYPDYTLANDNNTSYVVPSKVETETGKTFTFAGWYVDADGDGKRGDAETLYDVLLPRAHSDVIYVADWTWKWSDVTLTFYVKYLDEKTQTLLDNTAQTAVVTYETATQQAADSIAKIGSVIGYGGRIFTLDGWSIRKTDTEPLYDADHPLPPVTGDDRALSSAYARTFYGVYTTRDHTVDVSFHDGDSVLGSTGPVVATSTTVNEAFAATGAATPADKFEQQTFLGWALQSNAASELRGTSTIESLTGSTDTALSLYSVYGTRPTYTVRMRNSAGDSVLYRVLVKRNETVQEVLDRGNVTTSVPTQTGKYFSDWVTAAGASYSLTEPVEGSADVYASYEDVAVSTKNKKDITATVTVPWSVSSKWAETGQIKDVTLSLTPNATADTPLKSKTSLSGYSVLKSYDMKLTADLATGKSSTKEGEFGTASVKVLVGTQYRNATVRAFWLGDKDGSETVLNSDAKKVDSKGYITVNVGNYVMGDSDEGGNFSVAYIEGGKGTGLLASSGKLSGTKLNALSTSSLAPGLSSSGASGGLASGGANSGTAGVASADTGGANSNQAAIGDVESSESSEDAAESSSEGPDSNVVVLMLIIVALFALVIRALWRFLVVRPRLNEAEAEMPSMADQYSRGITF